ncbi:MAG: DUF4112 domain-containing protein [Clostridia bacterium]
MANRVISVDSQGRVQSVQEPGVAQTRERLNWLAWLLDSSIPIPGTRLSVGLDAVIGLVPFLGDLVGVVLASYIMGEAARLGAPRSLLWRMAFNIGVDGVVGIIPFAGDVFDAAWKANQRNVRLLNAWLDEPRKSRRQSRLFVALLVGVVASFLVLLGVLAYLLYFLIFKR